MVGKGRGGAFSRSVSRKIRVNLRLGEPFQSLLNNELTAMLAVARGRRCAATGEPKKAQNSACKVPTPTPVCVQQADMLMGDLG